MKGLIWLIVAIVLGISVAVGMVGSTAVDAYVELESQPESVADIIMRSRTTASAIPPERQSGMALGAGFFAIVLFAIASVIAFLFYGERFAKQWRLLRRKRSAPRPSYPSPTQPSFLPPTEQTPLIGRTPATRELPAWTESDSHYTY